MAEKGGGGRSAVLVGSFGGQCLGNHYYYRWLARSARGSFLCSSSSSSSSSANSSTTMEISWPSNVRHVAHVTFDRFNGFLGLPVEFEPEVPRRPPSARFYHIIVCPKPCLYITLLSFL